MTFDEWWVMRPFDGDVKAYARDAWFAGQQVIIDFEFSVSRRERMEQFADAKAAKLKMDKELKSQAECVISDLCVLSEGRADVASDAITVIKRLLVALEPISATANRI